MSFFSSIVGVLGQQVSLPDLIVKYLVIAGGGGGGGLSFSTRSGGGGAGGYRTSYDSLYTGTLSQVGSDIDGAAAVEAFGRMVAMSADGNRIAVGGPLANSSTGVARVYDWSGTAWVQVGSDIDGETAGEQGGFSVALTPDGGRLAVGSDLNDEGATDRGQVRVYDWSGSAWTQVGSDIQGTTSASPGVGYSLSFSGDGNNLAIGGVTYSSSRGIAYVFQWSGSSWSQKGQVFTGTSSNDFLGKSVALTEDGSRLFVGVPGWRNATTLKRGDVIIYDWGGSFWTEEYSIQGEGLGDEFGFDLDITPDGKMVAIGAPYNDRGGTQGGGHVRVYCFSETLGWYQIGQDIDGEATFDESGYSVALCNGGSRVVVGGRRNDANGADSGQVRVYDFNGASWVQVGSDIDGPTAGDYFGQSVDVSADGSRFVAGAHLADSAGLNSGYVKVFEFASASVSGISGGGANAESALTLSRNTNYTVTVGAGGAAESNGSNSVFSTITSTGGGRGAGASTVTAGVGGSGGGGSSSESDGASGTTDQGYAGGNVGTFAVAAGGGGGGAGSVGSGGSGSTAGYGGRGLPSSITGITVRRGGGGGGGTTEDPVLGVDGGGSTADNLDGGSGTVNTGGGAAGVHGSGETPGSGGSGLVVLRYPSAYSITLSGGLTGSTSTIGDEKVTTVTSGTGTVSFS